MQSVRSRLAIIAFVTVSVSQSYAYAQTPAPAAVAIAADHSTDAAAYVSRGLPPVNRVWTGDDLTTAARVLTAIATEDPTHLPRFQSAHSGTVFARLVARENVESLHSLAPGARINAVGPIMNALGQIAQLYQQASQHGGVFDEEMISLSAAMCQAAAMTADVASSLLDAAVSIDDAHRQQVEHGFHQMISGLGEVVAGTVTTFSERSTYRTAARARLAQLVTSDLPSLSAHLPPDERRFARARLTHIASQETDAHLAATLRDLAGRL